MKKTITMFVLNTVDGKTIDVYVEDVKNRFVASEFYKVHKAGEPFATCLVNFFAASKAYLGYNATVNQKEFETIKQALHESVMRYEISLPNTEEVDTPGEAYKLWCAAYKKGNSVAPTLNYFDFAAMFKRDRKVQIFGLTIVLNPLYNL